MRHLSCPWRCLCRIPETVRPFSSHFLWRWSARLRVSSDRDTGERGFLAARVLARNSGTSQDSPASERSQFLAAAAAARGEGSDRAEEIDPKAFPLPVSVRGAAAAAAAGAEMPKGGEGVGARGSRGFSSGGRRPAAAVPSARGSGASRRSAPRETIPVGSQPCVGLDAQLS